MKKGFLVILYHMMLLVNLEIRRYLGQNTKHAVKNADKPAHFIKYAINLGTIISI